MGFLTDLVKDAFDATEEVADRIEKWLDGEQR